MMKPPEICLSVSYGVITRPAARSADDPSGLVTRTSHTRSRFGPPLFVVTVTVITPASTTTTSAATG